MAGISNLALTLLTGNSSTSKSGRNSIITLDTSMLGGGTGAIGNATQTFQLYQKNDAKFRESALKDPLVKREIDYFKSVLTAGLRNTAEADTETKYFFSKINSITTVDALFQDKRLTDYIATAMGVGDLKDDVATLRRVLTTAPASTTRSITGPLTDIVQTPGATTLTATVTQTITGRVSGMTTDPITGAVYGTIDDPLLGKVFGTINGATTDGFGVTTGSISTKVTGTVSNQTAGSTPGTFTGTVTGIVSGQTSRTIAGSIVGLKTGTITVGVNAPVFGTVTASTTDSGGVVTGTVFDPNTGLTVTGTITGKSTDPISGRTTGTISGATTGMISSGLTLTSATTATTAVNLQGTITPAGTDGSGNALGTITDPVLGAVTGIITGADTIIGQVPGTITGDVTGTAEVVVTSGAISGKLSNIIYDSITMTTTATVTDPITGSTLRGLVSGQALDTSDNSIRGTVTASVANPATATVSGVLSGIVVAGDGSVTATVTDSKFIPAAIEESDEDPRLTAVAKQLVLYEGLTLVQNVLQQSKFKTEYYQAVTTEKTIRDEVDYFESKIHDIKTVDQLFDDQRLSDYIATSFGLDAFIGNADALKAALLNKPKSFDPSPDTPYNFNGVVFDPKLKAAAETLKLYDGISTIKTSTQIDKLEDGYISANNKSTIKSVDDIFNDRRLYTFVLKSVGLEDQKDNTALVRKALLSDPSNPDSLSAKLSDKRFKDAAELLQFFRGVDSIKSPELISQLISGYENVSYEGKIAEENEAVFLARYAETKLGNVKNVYELLADRNLRTVVGGALGIPQQIVVQAIETQAAYFTQRVDFTKLSDPKYVKTLVSNYLTKSDLGQIV